MTLCTTCFKERERALRIEAESTMCIVCWMNQCEEIPYITEAENEEEASQWRGKAWITFDILWSQQQDDATLTLLQQYEKMEQEVGDGGEDEDEDEEQEPWHKPWSPS